MSNRNQDWDIRISWREVEAAILHLVGAENQAARDQKRRFPNSDLAWATIRLLRKVDQKGIGSLSPVDQQWLRDLRDRYRNEGIEGLKKALDLDLPYPGF